MPAIYTDVETELVSKHGTFTIGSTFDFGNVSDDVLIDWSFSRKNSAKGIETFIPTVNENCTSSALPVYGFVCESQLLATSNNNGIEISTSASPANISGKILPGGDTTTLNEFWRCVDGGAGTCTDFIVSFRPLLKFTATDDSKNTGDSFFNTAHLWIGGQFSSKYLRCIGRCYPRRFFASHRY